jgi:hypothetical protein
MRGSGGCSEGGHMQRAHALWIRGACCSKVETELECVFALLPWAGIMNGTGNSGVRKRRVVGAVEMTERPEHSEASTAF